MTAIFGQYVQEMLVNYSGNPATAWKSKDAAIYLVTSLVAKGQTQKEGVTKTNDLVNITDFYQTHILPELSNTQVNFLPVLKADAIKYVMIFRTQLPQYIVKESIPHLVRLLSAESPVVYTYAATALEKILLIKQTDGTPLIKSTELSPVGQELLSNCFLVLGRPNSKENEYVMKTIMRTLSCLQESVVPLMPVMLPKLLEILVAVAKNPSKPFFNHYMFESLCLCIRIMCRVSPESVSQFEAFLFPVFQNILAGDVSEFIPYVFQVLALLLEFHPVGGVSEPYMALFPHLLSPALWDKSCNVPPLVRLLKTYIVTGPEQIAATDKLGAILGVFQKLIASKANDHEGFGIVTALIQNMPAEKMAQYLRPIYMLLFQRLSSSKTVKFVKNLLVYFCSFVNKYGAAAFIEMIDSIEPKFMGKVADRLFIPDLQKVSGGLDKKVCAVGVTRILAEAPQYMINGDYAIYWYVV
jgi:exportin-2 (importin alpha re-exporter)